MARPQGSLRPGTGPFRPSAAGRARPAEGDGDGTGSHHTARTGRFAGACRWLLEILTGDVKMRNATDIKAGELIAEAFGQDIAELREQPHVTDIVINNDDSVWAMQ